MSPRSSGHLLAALCIVLVAAASPVAAQTKAVRCGRVYQDRACPGQEGRLIGNTKVQKEVGTRHPVDAACQRRGAEAQKVIAAREAGETEDGQLAATTSPTVKRLVSEVYRLQGSAAEQRSAVETACMAERLRLLRGQRGAGAAAGTRAAGAASAASAPSAPSAPSGTKEIRKK